MNKKGFTLIELLAVIVILAVIALIATPVIMNAISNAKQGAWKDAAYGIIKATENVYAKNFSEVTDQVDTFFLYENGVMTSYPSGKTIDYKGSVPQNGGIVLHADGSITLAIHDGINCAVKTKTAGTVTVSTTDKATCISNIYYKQESAPFNNLVTNGDFSQGMTGWGSAFTYGRGSSPSVSNKTMYVKGNGDVIQAGINSNTIVWDLHKYFGFATVRVTNSNSVGIYLRRGADNGFAEISNPIADKWYDISGVSISTATTTQNFVQIYHQYNTPAIQKDKVMEVKNVMAIDLTTSFGPGNEPTKQEMNNNLYKVWIDSATNTPKRFTAGGWVNF